MTFFSYLKDHLHTEDLRPIDKLNITFSLLLALLALIFAERVNAWPYIVGINLITSVGILKLVAFDNGSSNSFSRFVVRWYSLPFIFITFKELYWMVHPIHPGDMDYLLIELDRLIFGYDPTLTLDKLATPALTEFLQICYSSFYILWIILGVDLLAHQKQKEFDYYFFLLMYGFYLSYIGYLLVPAIGPRFTLHDFSRLDVELPGLYLTDFLRHVINSGESITNISQAAALAQRDCFPSGHTEMTILTILSAIKFRARSAMVIIPLGMGLIFATVYMRYHYGIDVIAGLLFAAFAYATAPLVEKRLI
ncbi:MAG: phosphatase PAP2 family protein [Candidatus Kryptoniota bacterium]